MISLCAWKGSTSRVGNLPLLCSCSREGMQSQGNSKELHDWVRMCNNDTKKKVCDVGLLT